MPQNEKRTVDEALCPKCGVDATWAYVDEAESIVEIVCPDCGHTSMTRAEFDCAETDLTDPQEHNP